eukprot:UN27509
MDKETQKILGLDDDEDKTRGVPLSTMADATEEFQLKSKSDGKAPIAQSSGQSVTGNNTKLEKKSLHEADVQSIPVEGSLDTVWSKCIKYVKSLLDCDYEITENAKMIAGYHYIVPRYVLFRITIKENPDNDLMPYIVDYNRREGDTWVSCTVFNGLKAAVDECHKLNSNNVNNDLRKIDLKKSNGDVDHWLSWLKSDKLETSRAGSNALALSSENSENLSLLYKNKKNLLMGYIEYLSIHWMRRQSEHVQ